MRKCSSCGLEKPLDAFYPGNLGDDPDRLITAALYLLSYDTTRAAEGLLVEGLGSPNEEVS